MVTRLVSYHFEHPFCIDGMHPHLSIRCFCQSKLQCRIIKKIHLLCQIHDCVSERGPLHTATLDGKQTVLMLFTAPSVWETLPACRPACLLNCSWYVGTFFFFTALFSKLKSENFNHLNNLQVWQHCFD